MLKRVLLGAIPVAAALLAAGSAPVSAAETCIPSKVTEALTSCSGLHFDGVATKRAPVTVAAGGAASPRPRPRSHAAARSRAQRRAPTPRRGLAGVRSTQLLVAEIQGLETLLADHRGRRDGLGPASMRRLADAYVELETASFPPEDRAPHRPPDEAKRKAPGKVAALLAEAARSEKVERAARAAAIKHYGDLGRPAIPRWCQSLGSCHARPRAASTRRSTTSPTSTSRRAISGEARKVYLDLIQKAPASQYVPSAYLAFGELFFQEAQADRPAKWALAEQSYRGGEVPLPRASATSRSGTPTTSSPTCTGTRATSRRPSAS